MTVPTHPEIGLRPAERSTGLLSLETTQDYLAIHRSLPLSSEVFEHPVVPGQQE